GVVGDRLNNAARQRLRRRDAPLVRGRELVDIGEIEATEGPEKAPDLQAPSVTLLRRAPEVARPPEQARPQGPGPAQEPGLDEGEAVAGLAAPELEIGLENLSASQEIAGGVGAGK